MAFENYRKVMLERFFNYVKFDTESAEDVQDFPSTEGQKKFAPVLSKELKALGLTEVQVDEHGYVTATLEANVSKSVPTVGLIAHMDTSPEVSGKNVKPILHDNYQSGDICLAEKSGQVLRASENPDLREQIGHDIVTSDGSTLLGADNKAGIVEIFTAMQYLIEHPEIRHGRIRIAITPDEEVGKGTKYFDVKAFGADYAYTVDGEVAGEVENETFCADSVTITFHGVNVHPGYAKGKLINGIKIAADFLDQLPKDHLSPETTEKRAGYVHPHHIEGGVESTTVKFLIRDFTVAGLEEKEAYLEELVNSVVSGYPKAKFDFKVEESYRNMKYKLDDEPKVTEYALEAVQRSGLKPKLSLIRGGTDGSRLSYMGLLTPNLFTGGHNFHSRLEWISVQDMLKAVETIVNLVQIWEEKV